MFVHHIKRSLFSCCPLTLTLIGKLEDIEDRTLFDSTIDIVKPSVIDINAFVEINELLSSFVLLIKLEFIGNLFRNLLENCLGMKQLHLRSVHTDQKTEAKGCY